MRYLVCSMNVLLERQKIKYQAGTRAILVAVADGKPFAIADKCPHMGFPLSGGKYESGVIRCKEHGLEVDVRTGSVVDSPKVAFLKIAPTDRIVRSYPAVVENGNVYIEV
ncbi:MAG: Rieske 2Fe-2S domain-containing protein [Bacillota bacterium]|nr:Rieske 2Fe-2S domain-containing protein [Bacillota bacterium]